MSQQFGGPGNACLGAAGAAAGIGAMIAASTLQPQDLGNVMFSTTSVDFGKIDENSGTRRQEDTRRTCELSL